MTTITAPSLPPAATSISASTIPSAIIEQIRAYNVEWPKCSYLPESRRSLIYRRNQMEFRKNERKIEDMLNVLDNWDKYPSIAIDGMNGTGKSFLVSNMNRKYIKVNIINSDITSGSEYNYQPLKSLQYLTTSLNANDNGCIWDRCCYSNLIFYFVHYLMAFFKDQLIPNNPDFIYSILNTMAIDINLPSIITFMKSVNSTPILFLVSSNIPLISKALQNRNSINDIYNSKEYNYQMAQYHAYCYFAKILNCPIFDTMDFHTRGFCLGDMQQAIASKIDIPSPLPSSSSNDIESKNPNGFQSSKRLNNLMQRLNNDKLLFFDYSIK